MHGYCVVVGIPDDCTPSADHLPYDQAETSGGKLDKGVS